MSGLGQAITVIESNHKPSLNLDLSLLQELSNQPRTIKVTTHKHAAVEIRSHGTRAVNRAADQQWNNMAEKVQTREKLDSTELRTQLQISLEPPLQPTSCTYAPSSEHQEIHRERRAITIAEEGSLYHQLWSKKGSIDGA
ncbi:hypothetical protein Dimus_008799 [Dionaea muscipula]